MKHAELWQEYFESKMTGNVAEPLKKLVQIYYPLVRLIAQKLQRRLAQITVDELASLGVEGLYDAVAAYDLDRNTKFETYAAARIRGSMLDGIRKADWIPRLVRSNAAKMEKQRSVLESNAGHRLSDAEMAEILCISETEYAEMIRASRTPMIQGAQCPDEHPEEWMHSDDRWEFIKDNRAVDPSERALRAEMFSKLLGKNFTREEQSIIHMYYYQELSMKEISDALKKSESRVSQMHAKILERLKQKVIRNPKYYADIWKVISGFKSSVAA